MKKKRMAALAIALAVVMALGCAAFAATQLEGLADVFGFINQETGETVINEAAMKHITALNETYEGKTVKFTLTAGLYSPLNDYVTMSWTLEPLAEGEEYYILCDEKVGGSWLDAGSMTYVEEYILKRPAKASLTGYLTGEGLQTELTFSILRLKGTPTFVYHGDDETYEEFFARCDAMIAEGKLPMAGDGVIEVRRLPDKTYAEELLIAGAAELAEEFTVSFDLGEVCPVTEYRAYEGEKNFAFEALEIQMGKTVVTPSDSRIMLDIFFDGAVDLKELKESDYAVRFDVEGTEVWAKAINGNVSEPEKTEDGRWKISASYRAAMQVVYPEELILSIVRYEEDGGEIPLTGDGIRLKLTDK